jgi:hypothetical protein
MRGNRLRLKLFLAEHLPNFMPPARRSSSIAINSRKLRPGGPGFPAGAFRRINLSAISTLQELPLFDSRGAIHSQEADCDPALGSQAEDFAIAQLMMVIPTIEAWMKQRREPSGLGIHRSDVTASRSAASMSGINRGRREP